MPNEILDEQYHEPPIEEGILYDIISFLNQKRKVLFAIIAIVALITGYLYYSNVPRNDSIQSSIYIIIILGIVFFFIFNFIGVLVLKFIKKITSFYYRKHEKRTILDLIEQHTITFITLCVLAIIIGISLSINSIYHAQ